VANSGDISELVIRPALEYVLEFVREGRLADAEFRYPAHLRQLLSRPRLLKSDLRRIRKAVEGDTAFRKALAASLNDDHDVIIGWWLNQPDGWEDLILAEVEERSQSLDNANAAADIVREQRRRIAAEQRAEAAEFAQTESEQHAAALVSEIADLRAELAKSKAEQDDLQEIVSDLRQELRHTNDRLGAAQARLEKSSQSEDASLDAQRRAEEVRNRALEDRRAALADMSDLTGILHGLRDLSQRLEAVVPQAQAADERTPIPTPGRLNGNPLGMTIHLLKSSATVIIDGYNVTKGRWSQASLEEQRERLVAATQTLASRFGTDFIIVFDGADIAGAHRENRSIVRVMYSLSGVTADDVIREEVRRIPAQRPVVVVTDDQEIQRDVRHAGANIVSSAHFGQVLQS
jgi:predicted RNA-binding protein with PIN domain